ncbi:uncharacterized protein [Physcomitrium patens]|nr:uncharacterized protein LOC112281461 isoform X3 [Physcomitrium patens]XP_024373777.1 uncharacterized protein LOC112281461 isoform X3 [Physcomitrium patens]XP_024373779.1 uncharacterized protein LOC112281461 isoform X3 [Physcomitrium patens]|eukprot:XP_024373776.1 uncharacterized protein LOC112281461 isoform X3 [Physcomitrella patens]
MFLQNLCDKTYEITLRRGAKTMSSIHLKQCVQTNSVFDFLQEIVSKVPDIGAETTGEERISGRRKHSDGDDSDEEVLKRPKSEAQSTSGRGRGRGRGRGGGRGRGSNGGASARFDGVEKAVDSDDAEMDACSPSSDHEGVILDSIVHFPKPKVEEAVNRDATPTSSGPASRSSKLHGFDLNIDLDENGEIAPAIDELVAKEEEEQECDGPGNEATKELDVHSDNVLGGTLHMQGSELHSSVHPDEDDYD